MCPVQVKCPRDETHSHGDTGEGGAGGCPRVAGEGAGGAGQGCGVSSWGDGNAPEVTAAPPTHFCACVQSPGCAL